MAHILVVDDDIAMLQLVRRVLEKDQHLVTLQSNAKAVTEMDFSKFGLILLDVMMPEIDGLDTIKENYDDFGIVENVYDPALGRCKSKEKENKR